MKPMKHRIRGTVYQIDYFSNGKLQDLLTTGDSLYLIDRNGKDVDHYPVAFGDSLPAEWLNVVDYDNSRRYRFIMADSTGRIYMYDKSGKTLDGWNGLDVKGPLIQAPFHLRVHGRDCIVVVRRNGEINVLNRQGIPYAGFPVNPGPINGPVFVQPGPDFTGTLIFDITSDGVIQQVNLEGRIISKTQLYRPDKNSFFQIVPNLTRDNFIIARQDYNRVSLILRTGEALFDEDLLFSGRLKVQYFSFGVNNDIFAFTDEQQEFTYLYNRDGKLINNQPLESAFEISLTYSESASRYKVYSCYGNQFRISSFFRQ